MFLIQQRCINVPCMSSLQFPLCCAAPSGIMVMVYSPRSLRVRFLSSRDPVDLKRVILSEYAGPVSFTVVEVIILESEKLQVIIMNGVSGGVTVVVNIAVPPTAAVRLSGSTPSPWLKPGGEDSYMFEINVTETWTMRC